MLALTIVYCAGCGGGGGGGTATSILGLSVTSPSLSGKTGQEIEIPINVTGSGTVYTASFDVQFNDGVFTEAGDRDDTSSVEIDGLPDSAVCRYKWTGANTIRVLFASSDGIASGTVLVNVPAQVVSEATSGLTLSNVQLNQ